MHCGQTARLVVDGLSAIGIPARVLQMKGHVSSEFFAEGRWILAEADILNNGQFLKDELGELVGIEEVMDDPSILNSVDPYLEPNCWTLLPPPKAQELMERYRLVSGSDVGKGSRSVWASTFEKIEYGDEMRGTLQSPFVIKKTASPEETNDHHYFGWNHYEFCERSDPDCTN
jgi:hypothetical protein